jgi:hypothetical protein
MSINPFLSATKEDLDKDCRPEAIRAVRLAGAEPVTMETWYTDYEDSIEVCCEKVKGSSHYIGIFAFRRGWTPPKLRKSITEAEFDWAIKFKKPMAVFFPNPTAAFGLELRARASDQTDIESQAQETFLTKVKQKSAEPFDTVGELTSKVTRHVMRWLGNGLQRIAEQASQLQERETTRSRRLPDEVEVNKLGRTEHERMFEDTMNIILRSGWPKTACFLLYGPGGNGHSQLAARLCKKLETRPDTKEYEVVLGPLWRKSDLARLVEVIGSSIERNWIPVSVEALANRLCKMLKESDVVLKIANIHRLDEPLPAFAEKFWQPLVTALGVGSPYRLVVLATLEETTLPDWEQYMQPPLKKEVVTFDPLRLIKLPELHAFEEEELFIWLQNGGWLKPEDAQIFAKVLIDETKGMPDRLYTKLVAASTWAI